MRQNKKYTLKLILIIAIITIIVSGGLFILNKTDKSYVITQGIKLEEPEFVEAHAREKIEKISFLLSGSLNQLDNLYKTKKRLELSGESIQNISEKINSIFENIPFKIIKDEQTDNNSNVSISIINNNPGTDS